MSVIKYISKTLVTHILAIVVMIFVASTLLMFFQDQMWYQYIISLFFFGLYWYFMYFSTEKIAISDIKCGKYTYLKPVLSAAMINIVNILLIVLDITLGAPEGNDYFKLLFRYWNPGTINFLIILKDKLWLCIVIMLSYFPMSILTYYSGKLIEKREARKINEVRVSSADDGD